MRVISQDGRIDIPYDDWCFSINSGKYEDVEYASINYYNAVESYKIAKYTSKEKALKAMEILREQYERLEVFKVLASGAIEHMGKSLGYEESVKCNLSYRDMNVFRFPQDDEV